MSDDIVVKNSGIHGKGVFTNRAFEVGEVVVPWTAEKVLDESELGGLTAEEQQYVSRLESGRYIVFGEPARYVNHSCQPNTQVEGMANIAIRAIAAGEEVTTDYALEGAVNQFQCSCSAANCRGKLGESVTRNGVGVMVLRDGTVLLGKRRGSHGSGEYAFPGGHLEHLEGFADCAQREVREECDIAIGNIRFQYLANLTAYAPRHYVHIGVVADWVSGEAQVCEPDKVESWAWYDLGELPEPLFLPCRLALQSHQTGVHYFDIPDVQANS